MKRVLIASLISLGACNGSDQTYQPNAIIGTNDLIETKEEITLSKHGYLKTGKRSCNAFLTNNNEVTTALHCVGEDPLSFIGYKFEPLSGMVANVADVVFLDDTKDMITYTLDKQYKNHYPLSFELDQSKDLTLVGIDHESGKLLQTNCPVGELLPGQAAFEHSCDTKKKYSGSPLLQNGHVVGIHIGFNPTKNVNYALNLTQMTDDSADIAELEVDAELEWPHVRSPHVRSPHIRTPDRTVKVCGYGIAVNSALIYVCQASITSIPASCTAGAAVTAGTACAVSVGTAAGSCGVSIDTMRRAANACIDSAGL